jgi:small-conductance mechanosensitive channel
MRRFFRDMNPTLRGFLIIAAIVVVVMVLNLYGTLVAIGMLLRIAFFLAIAFFIYLLWRERRGEIGTWNAREQVVLYGSAVLIVAAVGSYFWHGFPGYDALGFIGVIACAGFAMFRVWRDRHTFS